MKYTFENILLSDDFQRFVSESEKERLKNPLYRQAQKDPQVNEGLLQALRYHQLLTNHKRVKFPDEQKNEAEAQLLARIDQESRNRKSARPGRFLYTILKVVAVLIIFVSLSYAFSQTSWMKNIFIMTENSGEFNTIVVPSGEKTKVVLSDGTVIWLNSESELRYGNDYNEGHRTVFLKGEGYFDVARQKASKFIVETDNVKVEALGTVFNVKSYPNDKTVETTLIKGSIQIEKNSDQLDFNKTIINPSEKFILHMDTHQSDVIRADNKKPTQQKDDEAAGRLKDLKQITISKVNTDYVTSWKDHLLVFDNETFEDIAVKMSRWYKLYIDITDEGLKKERYTGRFVNNETVYQVLEAINITTPIQYNVEKDSIEIQYSRN